MSYPGKVLLGVLLENCYFKECLKQFFRAKKSCKSGKNTKIEISCSDEIVWFWNFVRFVSNTIVNDPTNHFSWKFPSVLDPHFYRVWHHTDFPAFSIDFKLSLSGNQSETERTCEVYYGEDLLWKHFIFRQTMIQVLDWQTTTIFCLHFIQYTGGPRYIREIGTPKIGLNIMNFHIKRPRMTVNWRIGSRKKAISGSHISKIADKKTAYNEGRLYC